MIHFELAVNAGLEAADSRDRSVKEIHSVIDDIAKSVEKVTNGKVSLKLEKSALLVMLEAGRDPFNENTKPTPYNIRLYLKEKTGIFEDISTLIYGKTGYPCTIYVDGNQLSSGDRQGFEESMSNLFASARTGAKLKKLRDY